MNETDRAVEYDMSFSTNNRINYLLWRCNEAISNEDPLEWFKICKNLFKECFTHIKNDEEQKEHMNSISLIEKALNEYNTYIQGYNRNNPFRPPRRVFDLLFNWECKLRQKLDKMGLLFRDKDLGAF